MDIARHRGTRPSAKALVGPPNQRTAPAPARMRLIPIARRARLVDAIVRQAEKRPRRPLAPGPQPRQNETAQASGTLVGQRVCALAIEDCPRPGFGRRYYLLRLHKDRAVTGGRQFSAVLGSSSAEAALAHPTPSCGAGVAPRQTGVLPNARLGWGRADRADYRMRRCSLVA
jgi:hypothetical protein